MVWWWGGWGGVGWDGRPRGQVKGRCDGVMHTLTLLSHCIRAPKF